MNAHIVRKALVASAGALAVGGAASAADIFVSENISTSVTWTADNVYRLQNQIYVLPGASLTIEPGTVIASIPTTDGSGSLAVCRGAKIYVLGTAANPVIMTSANDNFVTWREAANEWGNLTIMGRGYISDSFEPGNTATFSANNVAAAACSTAAATTTTTRAASATSRSAMAAAWSASATSSTGSRSEASAARPTSSSSRS
ncbi:MAG: hypothetical protein ACO38P_10810 [Phycisphaerales bacterium]